MKAITIFLVGTSLYSLIHGAFDHSRALPQKSVTPESSISNTCPSVVMAAHMNVYGNVFLACVICTLTLFSHLPLSCHHFGFNLPSLGVTVGAQRPQAGQEQKVQMG